MRVSVFIRYVLLYKRSDIQSKCWYQLYPLHLHEPHLNLVCDILVICVMPMVNLCLWALACMIACSGLFLSSCCEEIMANQEEITIAWFCEVFWIDLLLKYFKIQINLGHNLHKAILPCSYIFTFNVRD